MPKFRVEVERAGNDGVDILLDGFVQRAQPVEVAGPWEHVEVMRSTAHIEANDDGLFSLDLEHLDHGLVPVLDAAHDQQSCSIRRGRRRACPGTGEFAWNRCRYDGAKASALDEAAARSREEMPGRTMYLETVSALGRRVEEGGNEYCADKMASVRLENKSHSLEFSRTDLRSHVARGPPWRRCPVGSCRSYRLDQELNSIMKLCP